MSDAADRRNMLCRAVEYVSSAFPGWGLRREVARFQRDALAILKPLRADRATGGVPVDQGSADERLPWWDRLKMISLFDSLVHENPILCALVDQYVSNVIPASGIRPVPQTGNKEFDRELSLRFDEWAETAEVRGLSFWDYQQPWLKTVLGHGDNLTVRVARNGGRIQGISANRITTPQKHAYYENTRIYQGVYTGVGATPLGYYVGRRSSLGELMAKEIRYIPAEFALHGFDPARFDLDNYRGLSRFLTCFSNMRKVESILQYRVFQEKMAAVFGIVIKKSREKPTSPLPRIGTGTNTSTAEDRGEAHTTDTRPDIELFQGMGITLNDDEDIDTIDPKSPGADFERFVRLVCRFIAMGANLPLEFCMLDWTQGNYYGNKMSATMGRRQFAKSYMLVRRLVSWVYRWKVEQFIEEGTVRVPSQLDRDPVTHETTLPPPIEVDELKAFQLHRQKVESNVDTWDTWCKSQNRVLHQIIEQRKQETQDMRDAKLPIIAATTPGVKLLSEIEKEYSA